MHPTDDAPRKKPQLHLRTTPSLVEIQTSPLVSPIAPRTLATPSSVEINTSFKAGTAFSRFAFVTSLANTNVAFKEKKRWQQNSMIGISVMHSRDLNTNLNSRATSALLHFDKKCWRADLKVLILTWKAWQLRPPSHSMEVAWMPGAAPLKASLTLVVIGLNKDEDIYWNDYPSNS